MANFVLVPGAWLGAWVWLPTGARLAEAGHGVYPVTLSGLAERADVPVGSVGGQTHVDDVLAVLAEYDLRDVVLVGHSYSGVVTGQVAARAGDRVTRAVFVDSNLPVDGASFVDGFSPAGREQVTGEIAASGGYWPPLVADDFTGQGMTAEQVEWLVAGSTPHPGRTLTDPASLARPLAELTATYLFCTRPDGGEPKPEVAALCAGPNWTLVTMDTGHWPMVSAPDHLADALLATV